MNSEQLKSLRTEDFMAPNPVLCYGGGGAFQSVAKYMVACSINIVGVIDANKQGSIVICDKKLPCFSLEEAIEVYGNQTIVIVTIANEGIFQQVKQNLLEHGFSDNKIFDFNVWTWLTVPSEKTCCRELSEYLQFMPAALSTCCKLGVVDAYLCEWFIAGRAPQTSMENYLEKRSYYMEESQKGRVPLYCKGCSFLTQDHGDNNQTVSRFIISDHAFCNADCVYCCDACSIPRKETGATVPERYAAILWALEQLLKRDLLNQRAVVQLAGGEITINPYKEKIYETVKRVLQRLPELQLQILSNCFIYDQEIANLLALGKSSYLQCDLDAGTPETYIKVKGFNKFDTVRENLKKYSKFGIVKLKYVVLPGWNDSQADFEGTVALLKDLKINELMLSPEFNVSRESNREKIREVLFAAARLLVLLEQNGIQGIFVDTFWKREHVAIAKRLCYELQDLQNGQEGHT